MTDEFHALQQRAGIDLACIIPRRHRCTVACHRYGFHDLRRGFATANATRLPAEVLQTLMRHQSYETTRRYIRLAKELTPALMDLHVPAVLSAADGSAVASTDNTGWA